MESIYPASWYVEIFGGTRAECDEALALAEQWHDCHKGDLDDAQYQECLDHYLESQGLSYGACHWAIERLQEVSR